MIGWLLCALAASAYFVVSGIGDCWSYFSLCRAGFGDGLATHAGLLDVRVVKMAARFPERGGEQCCSAREGFPGWLDGR